MRILPSGFGLPPKLTFQILLFAGLAVPWSVQGAGLVALPNQVVLDGREATQRILVQRVLESDSSGARLGSQVREGLQWSSSNPAVAEVADGQIQPRGDGSAVITVKAADQSATVAVTVRGFTQPVSWSFRHHVQAVLAKTGCNSGACHGALAGKGGFKLSLRGYDPVKDHYMITSQANGRRLELADPGQSLLLTKPSGAVPHRGGVRFDTDSLSYRVLADWISAGAPGPSSSDPQLLRIEALPTAVTLASRDRQQLVVRAYYSDGRTEDVTPWAKFTSAQEAVATCDQDGLIAVAGPGEGAVTAWFGSQIFIARVTVPYEQKVPAEVFAQAQQRNFIDTLVVKQLARMRIAPSPPANDFDFIRRAYLDTIGTLPTPEEVRAFLADRGADKRDKLIEHLLARPEFVDYWTYKWSDVLTISGDRLRPVAVKAYYQWIHDQVAANRPWDQFVRDIVTSQGSTTENGATNFFALHQDPENMSENVCQAFLGLSINCAKCHNHPLEKWTNDQYYAMANLFARVRGKGWGGDPRNGDGGRTLVVVDKGDLVQPSTGRPQPPAPLDGQPVDPSSPQDRRVHLANWLTAPDNPYFARSITNRVWANFFGVGLVEPVDDLRASNPASNEELLAAASKYLVEQKFDLKQLMRAILQSGTYQRSSQPLPENEAESRFYSRYYPKRLMAEVMLDAISQVTAVPSEFNEVAFSGSDRQKTDFYPKGTRALQLYDAAVNSYFLRTFGRNSRQITCECERSDEPSMVQVLHLANGDTINEKLRAPGSRVAALLDRGASNHEVISEVFLAALSRPPIDSEMLRLLQTMADATGEERRVVVEDLFWSVLSSREFLFNH